MRHRCRIGQHAKGRHHLVARINPLDLHAQIEPGRLSGDGISIAQGILGTLTGWPGQMLGKSPWLQSVHMMTDAAIGDIVTVDLLSAGPVSMAGAVRVKQAA
jgi:hypothetical protein